MTEGTAEGPPQPVTTLYVGNLPPTVDEQTLFQTFRPFGHIPDVQVESPCLTCFLARVVMCSGEAAILTPSGTAHGCAASALCCPVPL